MNPNLYFLHYKTIKMDHGLKSKCKPVKLLDKHPQKKASGPRAEIDLILKACFIK